MRPIDPSADGRRSTERSRKRCTTSSAGVVRTGTLPGLLEPLPVDEPDLHGGVLQAGIAPEQVGGPLPQADPHRLDGGLPLGTGVVQARHRANGRAGAGCMVAAPGRPVPLVTHAPRLDHRSGRPPDALRSGAGAAGRGAPAAHRRLGGAHRPRPPRLEPRRRRAHPRPAPGVRLAARHPPVGHRPPGLRPQDAHRAAPATSPRCARPAACPATRAGPSPSTTGSRTATPPRSSATPTASRSRRSTSSARAAASSP